MDPNENHAEQIKLALRIVQSTDANPDDAVRLAELVIALNDWVANGGFPPEKFRR